MKNFALFFGLTAALGGHASQVAAQEKPVVQSQWIVQTGHRDAVSHLQWSPDGKFLATVGQDRGQLFVRNSSGQIWARHELDERIDEICWSPDSRFLFVVTTSGLRLWDRREAAFVKFAHSPSWMLSEGGLGGIRALENGKITVYLFATVQEKNNAIWLWDINTGEKQKIWTDEKGADLRGFIASKRGKKFAISTDKSLTIYGSDGAKQHEFPVIHPPHHEASAAPSFQYLQFSPNEDWFSGVEMESGKWKARHLPSAKISTGELPDVFEQRIFYHLDNSGEITSFFRLQDAELVRRKNGAWKDIVLPRGQHGMREFNEGGADFAFQKLAAGTSSGELTIFDVSTPKILSELAGGQAWAKAVSFSRDGKRVVWGHTSHGANVSGGELGVFDLQTSRLERSVSAAFDGDGSVLGVNDAQFSPDGKWLVSTGELPDQKVRLLVFDAQTLRRAHTITFKTARFCKFNWSYNGQSFVAGTHKGEVVFWRRFAPTSANAKSSWTVRLPRTKEANPLILAVAVSPDARFVVAGIESNLFVLDAQSGKIHQKIPLKSNPIGAIFSRDGKRFWSATQSGEIAQWSVPEWKIKRQFKPKSGPKWCQALAVSPDESTLFAGHADRAVSFDLKSGLQKREHLGVGAYFNSLAVSRDGKWLAGAAENGQGALYDAQTGELKRVFHRVSTQRNAQGFLKTEAAVFDARGELLFRTSPRAALWREGETLRENR